jgi:hypothetical protein
MLNPYSNPPENFSQIFSWLYECARNSNCQQAVSAVIKFIFKQECSNQSFFPTDPIQKNFYLICYITYQPNLKFQFV